MQKQQQEKDIGRMNFNKSNIGNRTTGGTNLSPFVEAIRGGPGSHHSPCPDFGVEGLSKYRERRFHPSLNLSRRYYPHVHNMERELLGKLGVGFSGVVKWDPIWGDQTRSKMYG